jgi:uncharacterized damage-inducible protein DinB
MIDELLETWAIHNRITLYLLEAIPPEALGARNGTRGRSVAEQIAHLHNVRLLWLKEGAPDLFQSMTKLEKDADLSHTTLASALGASATAVEELLRRGFESGRIRGFKPHPAAFLGYLISHESHHRGQITLALKAAGFPIDRKTSYGLWEWGVR